MQWLVTLRDHFSDREELTSSELLSEFDLPRGMNEDQLLSALEVFVDEYGIPRGTLRPSDPLSWFTEQPSTRNALRWFFDEFAYEDRLSELNYHIKKARKRAGVPPLRTTPTTIREYVLAALGLD